MPQTYKLYKHLDGRLRQLGIEHRDLAYALNLSEAAMSHRFTGRTAWSLDEMYKTLDICRAGPKELHLYFPRDGRDFLAANAAQKESRSLFFPQGDKESSKNQPTKTGGDSG